MPDLRECKHSTFYRHKTIVGAAMATGHVRYCDLINPEHPDYDPRFVAAYRAMSLSLAGEEVPTEHLPPEVEIPIRPEDFEGMPRPRPFVAEGSDKHPHKFPPLTAEEIKAVEWAPDRPNWMLKDEEAHGVVYGAARDCPHRVVSGTCCDPDRCGPEGVHAGRKVDISVCYLCSIGRLGLE